MAKESDNYHDKDIAVQEIEHDLQPPPLYRVVLNNDDYTPMDFVVHILENIFNMERSIATRIMLDVHTNGRGVCGLFSREVAETKVAYVNDYARENQHPLLCTMEKE